MPAAIDLQSLFRDLESADLERALRLVTRALPAEEAGILSVGPDGSPRAYQRTGGPEAADPALEELKEVLAAAPAGEVHPLRRDCGRGLVLPVLGGNPTLFWAVSPTPWNGESETAFELAARYMARSAEFDTCCGSESARLDQRLGDAAQFSGRIAHDFDNILTGVTGFADLALMTPALSATLQEFIGEIRAAGSRGLAFTQQLHHLSRSGVVKPVPSSMAEILRREASRVPGLKIEAENNLPDVALEAGALQLVLAYLIDNAVEASPKGGRVLVGCRLVELSAGQRGEYLGEPGPGPHVEVAISDGGAGIRPDVQPRLFHEPFVTTKARHRGLGLPICYRILRVHRAGIRLESPPGLGTTARVVVPLAAARKRNPSAAPCETAHSPGG